MKMKVLIFSDGHGNLKKVEKIKDEVRVADLVLFAVSDFTNSNARKTGLPYVDALATSEKPLFSVMGKSRLSGILETTKEKNFSVDMDVKKIGELFIAGSGTGSKFTGTTPYERTDEELVSDLDLVEKMLAHGEMKGNALIVMTIIRP